MAKGVTDIKFKLEAEAEQDKLRLAGWILLGVAVMFVLSAVASLRGDGEGAPIFEAGKTILPPIATLVLGYYFSRKR